MKKVLPPNAILIPDAAQRVFGGQLFDVYQWPQKMFDGATQTFEMLRRSDTVQILGVKDDKLVFVEEHQPARPLQLHLPGGRTDKEDASWLETAQREMREETGMTFQNWRLIAVNQPAPKIEWFIPIFLASGLLEQTEQHLDTGGEQIVVRLESYEAIRKLILEGQYPMLSYLMPLFARIPNLSELLALPEFHGQAVDR